MAEVDIQCDALGVGIGGQCREMKISQSRKSCAKLHGPTTCKDTGLMLERDHFGSIVVKYLKGNLNGKSGNSR